jgi:chromosome segregation ATPase
MVEQIMYIGIGFLIAGLLVIGVIPLVHARAVRLTMRRLEALTPLSIAEIQADKDQLRAEFAMTMSRLEMSVEQMKAKTTNQLAELSRKSEAIGRLKLELGEKTAALFALEAKEKQLSDDLQTTQTELAAKTVALEESERALASARTELVQVTANFNDASVAAGGQRVELVALRAQTEALKGQIDSYEKETKALWDHLNSKTAELEAATTSSPRKRRNRRSSAAAFRSSPRNSTSRGNRYRIAKAPPKTSATRRRTPRKSKRKFAPSWLNWKTATAWRWRPSRRRSR